MSKNNFSYCILFKRLDSYYALAPFLSTVGLTASCFGLGATLSNLLGQMVVEKMGHVASLTGSLVLSVIPIVLFSLWMPETFGQRGKGTTHAAPSIEDEEGIDAGQKSSGHLV